LMWNNLKSLIMSSEKFSIRNLSFSLSNVISQGCDRVIRKWWRAMKGQRCVIHVGVTKGIAMLGTWSRSFWQPALSIWVIRREIRIIQEMESLAYRWWRKWEIPLTPCWMLVRSTIVIIFPWCIIGLWSSDHNFLLYHLIITNTFYLFLLEF
jgi:hypothetical protein